MGPITAHPGLPLMPPTTAISALLVNHCTSLVWSTRQRRRNTKPMQPLAMPVPSKRSVLPAHLADKSIAPFTLPISNGSGAKSQTLAQKAGMGTTPVPSRGHGGLFLAVLGKVFIPLWVEGFLFCQLVESLKGEKAGSPSLLMSLLRTFSTGWFVI
jgi:hypothetical protein